MHLIIIIVHNNHWTIEYYFNDNNKCEPIPSVYHTLWKIVKQWQNNTWFSKFTLPWNVEHLSKTLTFIVKHLCVCGKFIDICGKLIGFIKTYAFQGAPLTYILLQLRPNRTFFLSYQWEAHAKSHPRLTTIYVQYSVCVICNSLLFFILREWKSIKKTKTNMNFS